MVDDQDGVEISPLSGPFTEDGLTVEVVISKPKGAADGWTLEIVVDDETSVLFEYAFETDVEARSEFEDIVRENGLVDLLDVPDQSSALN